MTRRTVQWERMFPDELESAFAECPVAWLPYGLCDPTDHRMRWAWMRFVPTSV